MAYTSDKFNTTVRSLWQFPYYPKYRINFKQLPCAGLHLGNYSTDDILTCISLALVILCLLRVPLASSASATAAEGPQCRQP